MTSSNAVTVCTLEDSILPFISEDLSKTLLSIFPPHSPPHWFQDADKPLLGTSEHHRANLGSVFKFKNSSTATVHVQ